MIATTYKQAITQGLADALAEDDSVFLFGEDVAAAGGVFKATEGLRERFGDTRVLDTPISEQAIVGAAIGAALMGLRPIAEIMFADFAGVCFDGLANQLAKYRYMTGGQASLPVTVRMANGSPGGFGAQHSQSGENWFLNIPGLKIVVPGTPADAYDLIRAAIRDPDPVLYYEHKGLYNIKGPLRAAADARAEIGCAELVRQGGHVTVVATQLMRHRAVEATQVLAGEGIEVELIDLRTLVPLDLDAVLASIERTNHLVVVQESSFGGSWGATLVAAVLEQAFEILDAPPLVVRGDETPIAYAANLESAWLPDSQRIAEAIRRTVAY